MRAPNRVGLTPPFLIDIERDIPFCILSKSRGKSKILFLKEGELN